MTSTTPFTHADAEQWDPTATAPPIIVDRNPGSDQVGHGRTIPLVGGERPYPLEVVYSDGKLRVYADTVEDALSALSADYAAALAQVRAAEATGDRDAVTVATEDLIYARMDHAHTTRCMLQARENATARANGTWERLTDAQRDECTKAAEGGVPVGILEPTLMPNAFGDTIEVHRGFWDTPHCRLVTNTADYGYLPGDTDDDEFLIEPESRILVDHPLLGPIVVLPDDDSDPVNMIRLRAHSDRAYLWSLHRAGVVEVTERDIDVADPEYQRLIDKGRTIMDTHGITTDGVVGFNLLLASDAAKLDMRDRREHVHGTPDMPAPAAAGHSHEHTHSHDH